MKLQGRSQDFLRGGAQIFHFWKNHCSITFVSNFYTFVDIKIDFASCNISILKIKENLKICIEFWSRGVPGYLRTTPWLRPCEIESKTLNSEDFNLTLEDFEKSLKNSKLLKFRPLNYKLRNLKKNHNNFKQK